MHDKAFPIPVLLTSSSYSPYLEKTKRSVFATFEILMAFQLKPEPGSPPMSTSTTQKNYKEMSISQLVSVLRVSFQTEDFDKVEEELANRDAKLKAEIEPLREKIEVERLKRIEAEEKLKNRDEQCEKGKRAQQNYEQLLKEVKKNGLVEKNTIEELRQMSLALQRENCELKGLKKKWLDDGKSVGELRSRISVLEEEKSALDALSTKNSELKEAIKIKLTAIEGLRTENCKLADEKRRLETLMENLERKFAEIGVKIVKLEDATQSLLDGLKAEGITVNVEEVGDYKLENDTGGHVPFQRNEDTRHSIDAQSLSKGNKDALGASGFKLELENEIINLDDDDDDDDGCTSKGLHGKKVISQIIAENEHPSSSDAIQHKSIFTEAQRFEAIKRKCLSDTQSSTSTSSDDDDSFEFDEGNPPKRRKTAPDSSGVNSLPRNPISRSICVVDNGVATSEKTMSAAENSEELGTLEPPADPGEYALLSLENHLGLRYECPSNSKIQYTMFMLSLFSPLSTAVLLKPIFLHGFSAFIHLLLLLAVSLSWVWNKITAGARDESKEKPSHTLFKTTVFSSLGVSAFNFLLCLFTYFYWYTSGWSEEKLVTLLDLALKTLAWGVVCVCLQNGFFSSGERRFSFFFRAWCTFYLVVSCYCFVVDIVVVSERRVALPTRYLVSDVVSTCVGLFFCYVGYFVKNEVHVDNGIQEPLLNSDALESKESKGGDTVTPFSYAGFLSILTFSWVGPLIAVGNKKTLDLEDVPQLDGRDSVIGAFPSFREKLEADCGGINRVTTLKLAKSLIMSAWKEILITAFLALLNTLASYVGPYLIDGFVQYLDGQRLYENQGYFLVSAFFFAKLVECLTQRHWIFKLQQVGLRIRALLVTMIYNKALTLSCQSKQGHTSGEIINFMTVDAERVGVFSWYMHDLWMVALQVTLALLILYKNLGLASIAALVATVVIMLANVPLGSLQEKFQKKLMESKDTRMKATSEILRNMRILKLQGWEIKFLSKITELRKNEQGWLKKYVYTAAVTTFVFWGSPTFVSVVTFGTCMLIGIPLESGKILSALATFRILQEPIYRLPDTISMIAQTKVSLDRIVSFLRLDDLRSDVVEKLPWGSSDTAIEVVDGNFSWDLSSPNPTLQNINLKVFHGMRVAVCGTVGSGKSTLLSCVLGEVPKISGILKVCGTKAYVAQSPWIQSGKIEDNILFGERMDRERYEKVLEACSLKKDLEILSFGDQTIIGERGINLSGGQKQRIQIARALYQDADIYLFDDPFSAVDAHTGSHLFKECLLGLLSSKTVVYVTHQVEFLPAADLILVMKDGKITQCGKYTDLLNSGADFMELVGAHKKALSTLDSLDGATVSNEINALEQDVNVSGTYGFKEKEARKDEQNGKTDKKSEPQGQLVQEEEREKGKVGFSVYWKCITTAYGGALVPFILLAQILFQALQIGSNYWMAWATPISSDVEPPVEGTTLIAVYVGLAIGSSFCILARAMLLVTAGYKTATILFNKMHFCIFRAPMSFFDSTPSGRILNRASTDQSALDTDIPYQIASFAFIMIQLLGIIAVMSQAAWQVFVVFIPVIAVSIWYQQYYIPSARELARLVGVCKAPIIQHFSETISGTSTIRSFDQQSRFQETNMKLTDGYSRPKFNIAGAMEWLCFRLDMLSSITFAFSLVFLISIPQGFIDPGLAGLAVTYGLNLNMIQAWMIWNLCNMENKIISVERILQYTCISSEPPLVVDENRPDPSWPSYGEVGIQDLQVRYAPHLPLVLRGLTCKFRGGLKTGIVGRTGSGKSTLIQTLFRIVQPTSGQIMIDSINISSIGLHDLRSRLSIIPQDPTMFEGTVRNNLDPLEEYSDEQIWEALDKCQLGDEVRKKEGKLDSKVTENGENWSMGQRQLVCLGRVLLKKSKVLVLDEATASVDTATDNLIQQTLRQQFSGSTVITIAHRITSVLHSDMVLLLSQGLIEEYDTPTRLIENKSSSFAQLVAEYTMRSNSSFEKSDDH
ncbi:ABC transporter C family member 3 [Glycine soja]